MHTRSLARAFSVSTLFLAAGAPILHAQTCQYGMVTPPTRQRVNGLIYALAAYDDGSGAGRELYVGGTFSATVPATVPLSGLAKIVDGQFQPLPTDGPPAVTALEVFDAGDGPQLWAASGSTVRSWNGTGWVARPSLPTAATYVLKTIDLGDGPRLYAGQSGTSTAVQQFDGNRWVPLPPTGASFGRVHGLAGFDADGDGPLPARLFAAGSINGAGISGAAQWTGTTWAAVPGAPSFAWTKSLLTYDTGDGPRIYYGSHPVGMPMPVNACISTWSGAEWVFPVTAPLNSSANPGYGLAGIDLGPAIGKRVISASFAGLVISNPGTGAAWSVVAGSQPCPTTVTSYYGTLLAYNTPGSNVPVVVGVTASGTALQRLAGCPRCDADRNLDGQANLADLFDYLDQYFSTTPNPGVQQLFNYLQVWFAGC